MLPDEETVRSVIAERYKVEFAVLRELLGLGMKVHTSLCTKADVPFAVGVKVFLLGVLTRDIRRLRSCIAIGELGHSENVSILNRSLFEGLMSERFVLGSTIDPQLYSVELADQLRDQPDIFNDRDPADFRADLYRSLPVINKYVASQKLASDPMIGPHVHKFANLYRDVEIVIGAQWAKRLRTRKHYSGLRSVKACAELCGLNDFHSKVYGRHSHLIHANDALEFLKHDEENNSFNVLIATDVRELDTPLCMSAALFASLLEEICVAAQLNERHDLNALLPAIAIWSGERG